jgi:DNA-binding response OmpR family regulator
MPVMSGVEMARQLRGVVSTAEVPILLVTARGYVLDPAELAGTMIRAVMGKPFGLRQLQEQVAGLLGEGGARKVA